MKRPPFRFTAASIIILVIAIALVVTWLILTPPGLMGKADAIGYAVCHRIAERSYDIGGRELPLCARCTGMYLGAFAGLVYLGRKGRRGKFPPGRIWAVLGVFALVFTLDSLNSFAMLLPGSPSVYITTNLMRIFAGTGMGIIIPVVLWPVFNQTVWEDFETESDPGKLEGTGDDPALRPGSRSLRLERCSLPGNPCRADQRGDGSGNPDPGVHRGLDDAATK